ncbi:tail fiber domain-containing protein [Chryseolinea sp. T2]|uniref:tail fiber domain-containing protein n=1 Tax=Chryseolinea sp. T2 TaxID=3129255 RepID=UPI003076AAB2
MKSTLFLVAFAISMFSSAYAQLNPPTYYGNGAGTLGKGSSYFGFQAGKSVTEANEGGESYNSFFGDLCGQATTTGFGNTAMGHRALYSNVSYGSNTAIGFRALEYNTASSNTAVGYSSLQHNSTGTSNVAVGSQSMDYNRTGTGNTAIGSFTMTYNQTGNESTALGYFVMTNSTASFNTVIGAWAGYNNSSGSNNTSMGHKSLYENTSGHINSAYGMHALANNETGSLNSAFGAHAGPTLANLSNTTALGYNAVPTASNQVRIGNTSVTSIGGKVSWSTFSDGRFKKDVREDVSGLEFIKQLRPVSYTLDDNAIDKFLQIPDTLQSEKTSAKKNVIRHTGFIAQEVEAVVRDAGYVFDGVESPQNKGDHYAIRYAEFVVPLVKAVQELSKEVEVLKQQLATFENPGATRSVGDAVLFQNSPNPFSAGTEVKVSLPESTGYARLMIYTLEGKQVKSLPIQDRGDVTVKVQSGEGLSAGMYLYTLIVDGKVIDTKRMILTDH